MSVYNTFATCPACETDAPVSFEHTKAEARTRLYPGSPEGLDLTTTECTHCGHTFTGKEIAHIEARERGADDGGDPRDEPEYHRDR